ncbi:hypothetical protein QEZ48_06440 [Aquamicrobium lusatiense]|uniref:hypothetical protein n=1 Tax=Aquamicrobium lusatiense TaxID=89772 RepID=UPI0024588969|nr:hypothetical protein [Aquamicrobium lusatiense]MDH4990469.1 hypothetical protein [Aquamicrobium lusatiense]
MKREHGMGLSSLSVCWAGNSDRLAGCWNLALEASAVSVSHLSAPADRFGGMVVHPVGRFDQFSIYALEK